MKGREMGKAGQWSGQITHTAHEQSLSQAWRVLCQNSHRSKIEGQ